MLDPEDFYIDDGLMVLTERYHLKRGSCCGNACRHCPFGHAAVPVASERKIPLPIRPPAGDDGR